MKESAKGPGNSAPDTANTAVGDHVHQLLRLAAALSQTTMPSTTDTSDPSPKSTSYAMPLSMNVGLLSDADCLSWAQDLEALMRLGQALTVQIAGEVSERVSAGRFAETGARGAVDLLVQTLQLSAREAHHRIRLAEQIIPLLDGISGAVAPPAHPFTGAAFFAGDLSQETTSTVLNFLEDADRLLANGQITHEVRDHIERSLISTAKEQGPDWVRSVGNQIMGHVDPDGNKPSASALRARQGLFFRQPRKGLVSIYGACTIEQYEQIMAAIGSETNPNKHKNVDDINPDFSASEASATNGTEADSTRKTTFQDNATDPSCPGQGTLWSDTLMEHMQDIAGLLEDADEQPSPAPHDQTDQEIYPQPEPDAPVDLQAKFSSSPGWPRRLDDWEIPPRPPGAPTNAVPPLLKVRNGSGSGLNPLNRTVARPTSDLDLGGTVALWEAP